MELIAVLFPPEQQHEDWEDVLRCVSCGDWFDVDEIGFVKTRRGPICGHCAEAGEQ